MNNAGVRGSRLGEHCRFEQSRREIQGASADETVLHQSSPHQFFNVSSRDGFQINHRDDSAVAVRDFSQRQQRRKVHKFPSTVERHLSPTPMFATDTITQQAEIHELRDKSISVTALRTNSSVVVVPRSSRPITRYRRSKSRHPCPPTGSRRLQAIYAGTNPRPQRTMPAVQAARRRGALSMALFVTEM